MTSSNSVNNKIQENDLSVNRSTAGTSVVSSVVHSDNSNAASSASSLAQVGGASGGDPFVRFSVSGAQGYSLGIDNSDIDTLKLTDNVNPSTGNILRRGKLSGERTMPLQPAFSAYLNTAQNGKTGAGTTFIIPYDTEIFDQNNDFDNTTGIFTAPVTGMYLFLGNVFMNTIAADETKAEVLLVTTIRSYPIGMVNPAALRVAVTNALAFSYNILANMAAGDTAKVSATVSNGAADTINFQNASSFNFFHGCLLC